MMKLPLETIDTTRHHTEHDLAHKINEVIEAFNEHYHISVDTRYNTTSPRLAGEGPLLGEEIEHQ